MQKIISSLFLALLTFQLSAQDTISKRVVKKFVPLKVYEEMFGKTTDTTEFMYRDQDTLVSVPLDFDPISPDMVKVEYEPKSSEFLDIYKNVVYNTDKTDGSGERMRYWKKDINIYFDESVPAEHSKKLMEFANRISRDIDSLNISRNFIKEKSNYLVYYLNRENLTDYEPRIRNSKGGYYISWNGKQQIYDGKLKINTELVENEDYQVDLLKYHFFKSLGHFKSSKNLRCRSYLSDCKTARKLTEDDLELLKYHYSYGVCKGTDLENFTQLTSRMNKRLEENPEAKLYVVHHE